MNEAYIKSSTNYYIKRVYKKGFWTGAWLGFTLSSVVITILVLIMNWSK